MTVPGKSFELLSSFDVDYAPSSVKKWKSKRTGLQAAIIDKESPIVNGFFAVATEVEDDSGTPHTLEHLIFMGSKKYPYKGLLDTLSNVAFSQTNAWTATDQTVYTLTTAGWEGFKLLLPIYLDHILHPTLTDEACYTEVYHVDGEGKEKGVVFSEMQGIQNQPWFITALEAQRALYPAKSGYSSETGGLMENLRILSNNTIRKFHADSYRPSNLCVIVSGTVNETEFLELMEAFDKELPNLDEGETQRPFVDSPHQIQQLTNEIVKEVEFPDKDESKGEVSISWIGPKHCEKDEDLALTLLLEYLTDSSISLLTKNLVEVQDPLASELESNTDDFTYIIPYIKLNDVPSDRLLQAKEEVFTLLKEHGTLENFDLNRMREIIEHSRKRLVFQTEKSADLLTDYVITDFLYADFDGKDLSKNLSTLRDYKAISEWSLKQWVDLFQKYLVNNKAAVILGKPSKKLYKQIKADNKKMLKERLEELGEQGLKKLQEKLDLAQAKNDAPIPDKVLSSFPTQDPSKIKFINTKTVGIGQNKDVINDQNDELTKMLVADTPKDFPLYICIDQFKSEFISIDILLSSMEIPENLLPYFDVFSEIFTLPLEIDGEMIPYERVIQDLQNDTVEHSFYNGFQNQFNEMIDVKLQIKKANYFKAIDWFRKTFWNTKFEESRVKVAVDKLINALPSTKRSGVSMLASLQTRNCFSRRSLKRSKDSLETEPFYRDLAIKLDNGGFKEIEADLESIRSQLFQLNNFRIVISGDISQIKGPIKAWEHFINGRPSSALPFTGITKIPREFEVRTELGEQLSNKAFIITAPASESTFLVASTKIANDYNSEDSAALSLAASYLQAVEGPFWRGIRGTGLAYGANVYRSVETGQLSFDIYRGADAVEAYQVASSIVNGLANGTTKIDKTLFAGAVSSLVNSIASSESNYYSAAASKYLDDVLKKRGPNYNTKFIEELSKVREEDMVKVFNKYYVSIFDPKKSALFICAHPSNADELEKFFRKQGYEVEIEEVPHHGQDIGDEYEHSEEDDNEISEEFTDSESDSDSASDSDEESSSENEDDAESD